MEFKVGDKAISKTNELVYDVIKVDNGYVTLRYKDDGIEQNITIPATMAGKHFTNVVFDGDCEHNNDGDNICIPIKEWNELYNRLYALDERISNLYDELDEVTNAFQNVLDFLAGDENGE